jgi:hypothetical protein
MAALPPASLSNVFSKLKTFYPFSLLKGWQPFLQRSNPSASEATLPPASLSNVFSKLKTFYPFSLLKGWQPLIPFKEGNKGEVMRIEKDNGLW